MTQAQTLAQAIALRDQNPAKARELFNTIIHAHAESHEAEVAKMHLELINRQELEIDIRERLIQEQLLNEEARITEKQKNKIVALRKMAFWTVAGPASAFGIGLLLTIIIPGCSVDTGRGAAGCEIIGVDFGGLIIFLASFGIFLGLLGIVIIAPLLLFISSFTPPSREAAQLRKKRSSSEP